MRTPKVTVCIPVYNAARFIAEAVESVLAQSFTDFELLIIDNCSTDDTAAIINSYAARDRRIIFRANDRNLGMVANWNLCLADAQGTYVKYLFGDDVLSSGYALQRMVEVLDADRTISLVAAARNIIDAESEVRRHVSCFADGAVIDGTRVICRCLFAQRNLIGEPSGVMFRKKQGLRGFNGKYSQLVDLEMWFHLLEQGKYAHIGEPLSSFRVHPAQQTRKNVQDLVHVEDFFLLFTDFLERPYVNFGRPTKSFLFYSQNYRIWKLYRQRELTKQQALAKISPRCAPWKFLLLVPLYKIYNPFWKLQRLVDDLTARYPHAS